MPAQLRILAVAIAGATLYFTGIVNSQVIYEPSRLGAILTVTALGASLVMLVLALRGAARGVGDGSLSRRWTPALRLAWVVVSMMALVSLAWLYGAPRQRSFDWTPYHNDAIVLNECAAAAVLDGANPYASLDLFGCYGERGLGPDRTTPLRRGLFAQVAIYPSDDELDAAWALRSRGEGENVEFVWRPSYPALSFGLILPWVALGWDTNVLYLLCLLAALALVLVRTAPALRGLVLTGMLGAASLVAFTVGGSADLLYALPLAAAWLWRERTWSAAIYGIAAATKQVAWFFAPFLLIAWAAELGWRVALRRAGVSAAVFFAANAPWIVRDPAAWLVGIVTPVAEPMFPRGAGLVFLGTNGVGPVLPGLAYLALEAVAAALVLVVAWRARRSSPELGAVLPVLPLFFAYRSLFSYFFLLPLLAFAGLARTAGRSAVNDEGALSLLVERTRPTAAPGYFVPARRRPAADAIERPRRHS